jgi:hypothetical protein
MFCTIKNIPKKIDYAYRKANGDIGVRNYCTQPQTNHKITHPQCGSNVIIYRNGEGYDIGRKILYDDQYKNLIIGCWCNDNVRFKTPVDAQNHRLEKHPEEFED